MTTLRAKLLVGGASGLALLLGAQAAGAQTTDAAPAPAAESTAQVSEIVVTGTRIQTPGVVSPTPLTVVTAQKLNQVAPTTVDDMLLEIPQLRPDSGPNQLSRNSGSLYTGQSFVDLRGLGDQRTLLLIDGERPVPTNAIGTTSTSIIPAELIDRVDVVTGGASAAYGSDAVAGVVNFVLKDRLEGLEGSLIGGESQYGDNRDIAASLAGGFSSLGGRLHVVAGADFDDNSGVGNIYSRPWSSVQPGNSGSPISFGATRAAGTPALGWANGVEYATETPGGVINSATTTSGAASSALNQLAFNPNGSTYNLVRGPVYGNLMINSSSNPIATPLAQWDLKEPVTQFASLGRATYDLSDDTQAYLQLNFATSHVFAVSQYHQTASDTILASNPYLPAAMRNLMLADNIASFTMGRVDTEWLGTTGDDTSNTVQVSTGVKGQIFDRFKWDLNYNYGWSQLDSKVYGTRDANLAEAEYPVLDGSGNIVCGPVASNPNFATKNQSNTINPAKVQPGCVPLNPFGVGNPSAAAIAYVAGLERTTDTMQRHDVTLNLSGPIFDLPAGPVSVATGFEYRFDGLTQWADPLQEAVLYSSGNNQSFTGSDDVKEVYGELEAPILKDLPFAKSLDLNGAVRFTDYRTSGSVVTWKVGAVWEPVDGLRFRITESRDIRAPALYDLYNLGAFSATGSFTNPFNGQSGKLPQQAEGNPGLKPEKADTFTTGVTFAPPGGWLSGFHISVDYYEIKVRDVIFTDTATDILQRCYQGQTSYCSFVQFDNSTLGIADIIVKPVNLSELYAQGVDFELGYHHDLAPIGLPGVIDATVYATYMPHLETTTQSGPGGITTEEAGTQAGQPKWTMSAFVNYQLKPFMVGVEARAFSSIAYSSLDVGPGQPGYSPTLANSINQNVFPGLVYFNLNGAYDFVRDGRKYQLFANINNLLNTNPPAYALAAINLGGNPYDYVGRTFKVGVRFGF